MGILNFGSLNIDYVYGVPHILRAGETLGSHSYTIHCGGKGLNQSIALARAGVRPYHAGAVGDNGQILLDVLKQDHVDIQHIERLSGISSGHTIIQVDEKGQNCILLYGGANHAITSDFIQRTLADFSEGDWLVLQNEISGLGEIAEIAAHKGMRIIWNPSPVASDMQVIAQSALHIIILNEVEAEAISKEVVPTYQMQTLRSMFPDTEIVLTVGGRGSYISSPLSEEAVHQPAMPAAVVDTTAAGDTYLGYYVAMRYLGKEIPAAAKIASLAAAKAIGVSGAAPSIPYISSLHPDSAL